MGSSGDVGTFRKDLLYRLSVVHIEVPPLREREEDAVDLAQAFLSRYRDQLNTHVTALSDEARDAISRVSVVMAHGTTLQPRDLELSAARGLLRI